MPRPAIGEAARTEVLTVRVTPDEKKELIKMYGTPSKGLYAWVKSVTGKVSK